MWVLDAALERQPIQKDRIYRSVRYVLSRTFARASNRPCVVLARSDDGQIIEGGHRPPCLRDVQKWGPVIPSSAVVSSFRWADPGSSFSESSYRAQKPLSNYTARSGQS